MKEVKVFPSILSANFFNLSKEIELLKQAKANGLHVDIMDGHFVNNISFGVPVVESLKGCGLLLDVHLMIANPLKFVESFVKAGANFLTFHVECFKNFDALTNCVVKTKNLGCKVGLAIKPSTLVRKIEPFLLDEKLKSFVDLVVIMTVEPGFGGQTFMENMLSKVKQTRALNSKLHVAVDGGVNFKNARLAVDAGADWLVAGSAVFGAKNYGQAVQSLKFGKV